MKTGFFYEAKCRYFWRAVMAEMFATLTFVFVVSALGTKVKNVHDLTSQTLAIGFTAAILVKLFASISGGYFNPAVTVGASTNGEISSLRGTVYAVAQYCGAMLGAGLTYLLTNKDGRDKLNSLPTDINVNATQAFFMELILTMILTHIVLMVNDERSKVAGNVDSLSVGLAYAALHFVGFQYTGGSLNPARALGPSLISNTWPDHNWIYWVAPYIGAVIAGLIHRFLLKPGKSCEATKTIPMNQSVVIEMT